MTEIDIHSIMEWLWIEYFISIDKEWNMASALPWYEYKKLVKLSDEFEKLTKEAQKNKELLSINLI